MDTCMAPVFAMLFVLSLSGCQIDGSNDSNMESDINATSRFWSFNFSFNTGNFPLNTDNTGNFPFNTGNFPFNTGNFPFNTGNTGNWSFDTDATGSNNPFGCKAGCSYQVSFNSGLTNTVCNQASGKCSLTQAKLKEEVCRSTTACTLSCNNCA